MVDVLIVEDDADLAMTLAALVELHGYEPRLAFNGEEGLRAIRERLPDVILLDIEMPVLDGPGMAHRLLIEDAGKELVPIVVSSGYGELDAIANRIGTPYWIAKPCSFDGLERILDRAIAERRAPEPRPAVAAAALEERAR